MFTMYEFIALFIMMKFGTGKSKPKINGYLRFVSY